MSKLKQIIVMIVSEYALYIISPPAFGSVDISNADIGKFFNGSVVCDVPI